MPESIEKIVTFIDLYRKNKKKLEEAKNPLVVERLESWFKIADPMKEKLERETGVEI